MELENVLSFKILCEQYMSLCFQILNWLYTSSNYYNDDSTNLFQVFPSNHVKEALHTVFKSNVMGFANGNMGAINGTRPDGKKDITSCQSEEFWTGVTSALSAQMVQEVSIGLVLKTGTV